MATPSPTRFAGGALVASLVLGTPTLAWSQSAGAAPMDPAATPWSVPASVAWPSAHPEVEDAPTTEAEPRDERSGFALDVAAVTAVPLFVGAEATLELPHRLLLRGEVGALPQAYVGAFDSILYGANVYDLASSELVRSSLGDSLVVRLSGGIRPFEDHGLELLGGYTMVSLGATATGRDVIEAASGVALPAGVGTDSLTVDSTIHAIHAGLGWRWVIADHLSLRTSLGYVHAVGASSSIDVPSSLAGGTATSAEVGSATRTAERRLDDLLTTYGRLPVVEIAIGYRF